MPAEKEDTTMYLRETASRAAKLLKKKPALFGRVVLAKINTARKLPPLPVQRRIQDVIFEYELCNYGGTAPMYFGSYALLIIEAMKKFLKPGDAFLDVGANIGYLSAIAAGVVGRQGQVHCFEPVPAYFYRLQRLADLNPEHSIFANARAAGETAGTCTIYVTREPGQNTMVPFYKSADEVTFTLEVSVVRLDSYIEQHAIGRVGMIKIDAEGFEFPILKGLRKVLEKPECRPAIVCEIAPRAYPLMRTTLAALAEYMAEFGYTPRDLIDGVTPVDLTALEHVTDVLFIPAKAA
jgi:FkbM family methyltransferase